MTGRITMRSVATWAVCWTAFAGSTALLLALRGRLDKAHIVLVFLLVVLSGSAAGGRLKDALLAGVSHDLRTPLTSIKGLAREISASGDERALITAEEEADRLNRWVSDLLDVARLNGGSLRVDVQVNAIEDLLGATLQQFAGRVDRDRLNAKLR